MPYEISRFVVRCILVTHGYEAQLSALGRMAIRNMNLYYVPLAVWLTYTQANNSLAVDKLWLIQQVIPTTSP